MKPLLLTALTALALCGPTPPLSAADKKKDEKEKSETEEKSYRTFKAKNGKTLKARVLARIDDERYKVETPEGKTFTLTLSTLSRADQTFLELWEPNAIVDIETADLKDVLEKKGYSSADLVTSGSRLFVKAGIGEKEFKFVLDPGRNFSTLDPETAKALDVKLGQGSINFRDATGKTEQSQQGTVKGLTIGEMELKSHLFQVLSMSKLAGGGLPKDTAGAIGGDLLKKLNALVDHGGQQIFVKEKE